MSSLPRTFAGAFLLAACSPAEPATQPRPTPPNATRSPPAPAPAPAPEPEPVVTDPAAIRLVAAGGSQVCVLMGDGAVRCLDRGGDGRRPPTLIPVEGVRGATALAVGRDFRCALLGDRTGTCWGSNAYGQLGRGDTSEALNLPPAPMKDLAGATAIVAGDWFAAVLLDGGVAAFWGRNNLGQFGDGKIDDRSTATPSTTVTEIRELRLGGFHGCAIGQDATVRCWGVNERGQIGDGKSGESEVRRAPVLVADLANVRHLALGGDHSCALLTDATARCWGANEDGQLGDGGNRDSPRPVAVADLSDVQELVAGGHHTCARLGDGAVRCWGFNASAQLGDDTFESHRTPTTVAGLGPARQLAAGNESTCALLRNGELWCWGSRIGERPTRIGP